MGIDDRKRANRILDSVNLPQDSTPIISEEERQPVQVAASIPDIRQELGIAPPEEPETVLGGLKESVQAIPGGTEDIFQGISQAGAAPGNVIVNLTQAVDNLVTGAV